MGNTRIATDLSARALGTGSKLKSLGWAIIPSTTHISAAVAGPTLRSGDVVVLDNPASPETFRRASKPRHPPCASSPVFV